MVKRWGRLWGHRATATIIEEHGGGGGDAVDAFRAFALAASSSPWVELIGILLGVGTGWYLRERDLRAKRERQQERRRLDRRRRLIATNPAASLVTAGTAADGVLVNGGDGGVGECVLGRGDDGGTGGRAADLRRTALSERLARGIPVLGAAWLWQVLSKMHAPPSLLDPLAAVLSCFFLELLIVSVPRCVWNMWDIGNRGATGVASAAAGAGVPRLTMPESVPEEMERKEEEEDAAFSFRWGVRRARAGGTPPPPPPPPPEVGLLLPSNGGGGGPTMHGVGSAGPAPPVVAAFEEVAPTTPHGAAATSGPGPRNSGSWRRSTPRAPSAKKGAAAVRDGGATAAGTSKAGGMGQGQGSEGTRNTGEAAVLTMTRSQREKKPVVIVDATVAAAATTATPAAASPATPAAGLPSPPPPAAGKPTARRTTTARRPRTVTSAVAATAAATIATPSRSSDVTVGPSPSTAGSARSTGAHATPPQRPPGSSRGSGKRPLPSGGYNSLSGMRRSKRQHPESGGGGGGGWWSCSHGVGVGESPAAKRGMMMKTRRLSSGSSARGSGVGVGLGAFGGGFGDGLGDFEFGPEERQQRQHLHQQSRHSQQQQGRQQPTQGQGDDGQEMLRDPHQGQPQAPEPQVEHKPSSESDAVGATPAVATAEVAVSNRTPTPPAKTAGHPPHAAPASCSSSSRSTSATVASKEPSSTSSLEASPPPPMTPTPAAATETGSGGKESNRGMPAEPTAASQGQGALAEPGADSGSSAGGPAGAAGWDSRETLVALYEPDVAGSGEAGERGTPVPPELRPPEREGDVLCEWSLEQLRVDDEVGMFSRGTFGKVVAVRTQMERQLAVKIVAKSGLSPDRYIERELELLEACSVHPNVVGLHGVIQTSARVYVLMPLADTDLAAMVKNTVLDEKQASFCVKQVLGAVEFLHSKSIVHRDIKPANILVLSNKVLLADFGLAKQLPKGQPGLLVGACGTKPYLAPELVRDVPYDAAVDLWAVGVVTYELLHGYTPFSPKLVVPRSWDGVVREEKHSSSRAAKNHADNNNNPKEANGGSIKPVGARSSSSSSGGRRSSIVNASFSVSVSVSESSGSIVNERMFERSAPPAPGGSRGVGLDRAWLAGQAHQALLFGKGGENDEYQAEIRTGDVSGKGVGGGGGGGGGGGAGGWGRAADAGGRRRGHREADQLKLLDAIVRGVYEVEESCVGAVGADFIAQLLHVSPARRMTALLVSEHPFLGPPTRAPPRRRLARAEVAANVAERASRVAERHEARIEQQQRQVQQQHHHHHQQTQRRAGPGAEGPSDHNNDNPLSDIAQLCAAMAAEARSLVADVKRWDKEAAAAAAAEEEEEEEEQEQATGGGGTVGKAGEAAGRAKLAVRRAELLAREACAGSAAAKAMADTREHERTQEEAAAAVGGSKTVGVGVVRATGGSNGNGKGAGNGTAATSRD